MPCKILYEISQDLVDIPIGQYLKYSRDGIHKKTLLLLQMDPTKQRVWDRLHQAKHTLKYVDKADQFVQELSDVKVFLNPGDSSGKDSTVSPEQKEFMSSSQYVLFLDFLVEQFSVDWVKCLPAGDIPTLVDVFFLHGCPTDAFMVLCHAVADTR